jgi:hypothetical protein
LEYLICSWYVDCIVMVIINYIKKR